MSLRALTWAFDLDVEELTSTLTLVLITLANYANEEDETYPRQSTIAKKTKLSRQTVNTSLARLEELGLITCTPRTHSTGAFRSSIYKLLIPVADRVKSADMGDSDTVSNKATRRVQQDDRPCQAERQVVSNRATEGVGDDDTLNRILEPSLEPKNKKRGSAAPWPEDAFDQFWKLYPNKDAKPVARKIFQRISDAGNVEFSAIMEGLRLYVNKDDFRSWAMPTTWLNQDRWEARPPQKKSGVAKHNRHMAI